MNEMSEMSEMKDKNESNPINNIKAFTHAKIKLFESTFESLNFKYREYVDNFPKTMLAAARCGFIVDAQLRSTYRHKELINQEFQGYKKSMESGKRNNENDESHEKNNEKSNEENNKNNEKNKNNKLFYDLRLDQFKDDYAKMKFFYSRVDRSRHNLYVQRDKLAYYTASGLVDALPLVQNLKDFVEFARLDCKDKKINKAKHQSEFLQAYDHYLTGLEQKADAIHRCIIKSMLHRLKVGLDKQDMRAYQLQAFYKLIARYIAQTKDMKLSKKFQYLTGYYSIKLFATRMMTANKVIAFIPNELLGLVPSISWAETLLNILIPNRRFAEHFFEKPRIFQLQMEIANFSKNEKNNNVDLEKAVYLNHKLKLELKNLRVNYYLHNKFIRLLFSIFSRTKYKVITTWYGRIRFQQKSLKKAIFNDLSQFLNEMESINVHSKIKPDYIDKMKTVKKSFYGSMKTLPPEFVNRFEKALLTVNRLYGYQVEREAIKKSLFVFAEGRFPHKQLFDVFNHYLNKLKIPHYEVLRKNFIKESESAVLGLYQKLKQDFKVLYKNFDDTENYNANNILDSIVKTIEILLAIDKIYKLDKLDKPRETEIVKTIEIIERIKIKDDLNEIFKTQFNRYDKAILNNNKPYIEALEAILIGYGNDNIKIKINEYQESRQAHPKDFLNDRVKSREGYLLHKNKFVLRNNVKESDNLIKSYINNVNVKNNHRYSIDLVFDIREALINQKSLSELQKAFMTVLKNTTELSVCFDWLSISVDILNQLDTKTPLNFKEYEDLNDKLKSSLVFIKNNACEASEDKFLKMSPKPGRFI